MTVLCLQMDNRHQFIIGKLADAIGLEVAQVEDFIVGDENVSIFSRIGGGASSVYCIGLQQQSIYCFG